jgi:molybdopterin-containing oxidoreductase family membrane subunit
MYDTAILVGSFGMFFTIFLLYLRVFPAISIAEIKPVMNVGKEEEGGH